jgi:hypothetical protein
MTRPKQLELPGVPKPPGKTGPTDPTIPAWLRKAIETENPTAFGKLARWRKCRCGAWTIDGWDANDDYAGHATTDPTTLTTTEELQALLQRRWTYHLIIDNGTLGITLSRRDQWTVQAKPPPVARYPVTPAHKCNHPIGSPIPSEQFTEGNN